MTIIMRRLFPLKTLTGSGGIAMLKVQLRSKLGALDRSWQSIEDILTGDFFGVLDYLPRATYLRDFLETVAVLNGDSRHPTVADVDWENVRFEFWPRVKGSEESAEPDVVLISDRWVIVVEVKLDSGLGYNQPWREFCVGKDMAQVEGILTSEVYYLLVARGSHSIASTFKNGIAASHDELLAHASQIHWHQVFAWVERWHRRASQDGPAQLTHQRMLVDLREALRRRSGLTFSGFSFEDIEPSHVPATSHFCPERFTGFSANVPVNGRHSAPQCVFLAEFEGFLNRSSNVAAPAPMLNVAHFCGFLKSAPTVTATLEPCFVQTEYREFLKVAPLCVAAQSFIFLPR